MLTYHHLSISLKPSSIKPLPFIGSTLRGAFGMSLKKVVCINPSYKCAGCFAKDSCLYYDFYEVKNRAHQYRFDFELNQESYDFSLYLFESATQKLPYVISAIQKMLTEQGLGVNRDTYEIEKMRCNDKDIYHDEKFDLSDIAPIQFKVRALEKPICLTFKTPLRMKQKGKLLSSKPTLETLLYSISNRLAEIKDLPKVKLTYTPSYKEQTSSIKFVDQTRRSNRQKAKLQIGGIVGYINYDDIDENSLIFLQLGELLGVGKQTVFGMGKIELTTL